MDGAHRATPTSGLPSRGILLDQVTVTCDYVALFDLDYVKGLLRLTSAPTSVLLSFSRVSTQRRVPL
jgi:hypothetical protein